jgi:formyl-CoA transferase/CoA:oxalate CoA-transferase
MAVTLPHQTAGEVTVTGLPIGLSGTPGAIQSAPPLLGQHTDEILMRIVGYRRPTIARLRQAGVV